MQKISGFIFLVAIWGCNNTKQVIIEREPMVYYNIDSLQKIIDLSVFKPDSATYVYYTYGDENDNNRVPGPKDYTLEAILFYSDSVINKLKGISSIKTIKELKTRYEIEMKYRFLWADRDILKESGSPNKTIEYSSDKFYKGALPYGSYIIIGNVVLLKMFTM
jgi:hypothetical protein